MGMKSATAVARVVVQAGIGFLLVAGPALAGGEPIQIPTLGGVGLVALAGALSAGGAWLLRNRDKQK